MLDELLYFDFEWLIPKIKLFNTITNNPTNLLDVKLIQDFNSKVSSLSPPNNNTFKNKFS